MKLIKYTRSEKRAVVLLFGSLLLINITSTAFQRWKTPVFDPGTARLINYKSPKKSVQKKELIELNSADTLSLQSLFGIGPSYARRILKYRELLGGYFDVGQLLEVYGMDSARFLGFSNSIYVDSSTIRPLNINIADFRTLLRHPYISYEMVKAAVQLRDKQGPLRDINDLWTNGVWPDSVYMKLHLYLVVE